MKRQLIPITIGVTGHRDIPEQDKPRIREVLQSKFQSFKANYPHSPLQLISGLAEGADQIAAEVALEVGFALVAALPMPIEMYEKDFVLPSSLQHFRELLGNAEQINICSPKNYDELRREDLYLSYGHYIVRHAQVVIALWDGTFEQLTTENQREIKVGGTADVVRICRGIMPDKIPNLLVPPESKRVDHLWVRRENENPLHPVIPEEKIATWEVADITEQNSIVRVDRMLRAIDQYNDHAKSIPISAIIQCRNNLVSDQAPVSIITSLSTTVEAFSLADAATGIRQSERAKYVNLISGLTITSILFKEIYSPTTHWVWLSAHIILAILALWAFYVFFKGKSHRREEQYLDWRALAEGLRVQIFWKAAGIEEEVSDHYLISDRDELGWIIKALRSITMSMPSINDPTAQQWISNAWLESQNKYYETKAPINLRKHIIFEQSSNGLFFIALILTITTLFVHIQNYDSNTLTWLILASSMSFVMSAVLKVYQEQMAYMEQHNRYSEMGGLFKKAGEYYKTHLENGDIDEANQVLVNIGKEALSENADWLRLHRQRQFEVDL